MCTAFEGIMAKKCPKMCNLCGKYKDIVSFLVNGLNPGVSVVRML